MQPASDVTVQPPTSGWPTCAHTAGPFARETRCLLHLPDDRPVIMSGHQAELWHPGIAAKAMIARAAADNAGGIAAWITVDQDANDPTQIPYPTHNLRMATWSLASVPKGAKASLPAVGTREPLRSISAALSDAHPALQSALQRLATTVSKHAASANLAAQFSAAAFEPLGELARTDATILATSLIKTPIFAAALDLMLADPLVCAATYNAAVADVPAARLRPLVATESRIELPLWRLRPGIARTPVFAHDLASIPREQLAPRALLMTALLRAAACDVFIHGTGGGIYDRATDAWWFAWLNSSHSPSPAAQSLNEHPLAPTAVVTATRRLNFPGVIVPAPEQIDRAVWQAHRSLHDPAILGDADLATAKRDLANHIALAPRRSSQRRQLYRQMHALVAQMRTARSSDIAAAKQAADEAIKSRELASVVHARTWPCTYYPRSTLEELCYTLTRTLKST